MRSSALVMVTCVLILTLLAGCISSSSSPPPPPYSSSASIRTVIASTTNEWSLSMGCYTVVTGYAFNTGAATTDNVVVYLTLTYPDGTIRDSTAVYIGSIPSQETRNFHVILDRECGDEYALGVTGTP